MRNQSQTRYAQTVSLISHNADFCELRISKTPANAHKTNYFSALVIQGGRIYRHNALCFELCICGII